VHVPDEGPHGPEDILSVGTQAGGIHVVNATALTSAMNEQIRHAHALLTQPDATIASIARLLGVSRSTIYKYVPELKTGGDHQAIDVPAARAELETGA
jgi:ACT domain-containing protein